MSTPVTSKRFPLFILASVCWSLQCLISALTQGGGGAHLFRLTCSVVLWGGRNTANKYCWQTNITGVCGESPQCLGHNGFAPAHGRACFPGLHCSGSRLLHWEPSEAGPGLLAPPRSKPLRFRHSGSPQRRRLGWACVLCSSQVQAAQVMRCLASTNAVTYRLPATRLNTALCTS